MKSPATGLEAETIQRDRLGFDAIWLVEHHFGGGCAYADPLNFACSAELATRLQAKYYGSNYNN